MRIKVINPNTTAGMTAKIGEAARPKLAANAVATQSRAWRRGDGMSGRIAPVIQRQERPSSFPTFAAILDLSAQE